MNFSIDNINNQKYNKASEDFQPNNFQVNMSFAKPNIPGQWKYGLCECGG